MKNEQQWKVILSKTNGLRNSYNIIVLYKDTNK